MTGEPLDPLAKWSRERAEYQARVEEAMRKALAAAPKTEGGARCAATNRNGTRCKRAAVGDSPYCAQHWNYDDDDGYSTFRGFRGVI